MLVIHVINVQVEGDMQQDCNLPTKPKLTAYLVQKRLPRCTLSERFIITASLFLFCYTSFCILYLPYLEKCLAINSPSSPAAYNVLTERTTW